MVIFKNAERKGISDKIAVFDDFYRPYSSQNGNKADIVDSNSQNILPPYPSKLIYAKMSPVMIYR